MTFKPTNTNLQYTADSIERSAKESMSAWILLGQFDKYGDEMKKIRILRHALTLRGLRVRAEYLASECVEIA
jgi:hypothetical protein